MNSDEIAELTIACARIRRAIYGQRQVHRRKMGRLRSLITLEFVKFKDALATRPQPLSRKQQLAFGEFHHSYELLALQIGLLVEHMTQSDPIVESGRCPAGSNREVWEEHWSDLEDALDDTKRKAMIEYRASLVAVLEILDAIERIQQLRLPQTASGNKAVIRHINALYELSQTSYVQLILALLRRQVKPIALNPGDYPPIETTRLISRSDTVEGDNYVIEAIVTKGYTYRDSILRKTAVTIKSKAQE